VKRVCLIGSHVRPWAENAAKHGHKVAAIDGFNDFDLGIFCDVTGGSDKAKFGRDGLLSRYAELPNDPIIFCSPAESHPEVLEEAAKTRSVLNAPPIAIKKCRNIDFLQTFGDDGILSPENSFEAGEPRAGWIIKRRASGGGLGIRPDDGKLGAGEYRQKFIRGVSVGGIFFTSAGTTQFFGFARHVNNGFKFAGSVFPADIEPDVQKAAARFGERFAKSAGLAGWWGADFIVSEKGAHLLEVNPRFTAGTELAANAHDIDLVATQSAAYSGDKCHMQTAAYGSYHGREALYARGDVVFKNPEKYFKAGLRDVPREGGKISKGEPLISVYATGSGDAECAEELRRKKRWFERELYGE
jgi:predicted ATP-grasp superfamily ATP-dependent carboligase